MVGCILAKTLLIIGAGPEQVPAYQIAKKRNLTIVGTDIKNNAPGLKLADFSINASTRDPVKTLSEIQNFSKSHQIDGVMTIANDVPLTVATIANYLGTKSISIKAAKNASNKYLMKKCFKEHNVACPQFQKISSLRDLIKFMKSAPEKKLYVLKPLDERGARGVLLINKNDDLKWAYKESRSYGSGDFLIIEEFIEGMQFSTESFLLDGKCYTAAVAERNYKNIKKYSPYIIEDGGDINHSQGKDLLDKIDNLILDGANAIGINEGIIKGDLVLDRNGDPLIIEIAARLSGGWFASHQIPAATNIDLISAVISYSLNEKIAEEDLMPFFKKSTSIRYWYPDQGSIKEINGIDKLESTPGIIKYGFFNKVGDIQKNIRMHSDRFGYVIVQGKSNNECKDRMNKALSSINIIVK